MKFKTCFFVVFLVISACNEHSNYNTSIQRDKSDLISVDGPYIYDLNDSLQIVRVIRDKDSIFFIEQRLEAKKTNQQFLCEVSNKDKDDFSFGLIPNYKIPEAKYNSKERIFVTSDIEGNFNAFYSMLVGNKIMDENYNWIFGDGHLVIAGDMVDRGDNVMPCLWLLYKLEQDAKKENGQVHFILGNHDVMTVQLDTRYVQPKYIQLAKTLSGEVDDKKAYKYLMSSNNELVKWIKSKNAVEKIGNNLFLHGGISADIVDANLSMHEINNIVREHMHEHLIKKPGDNDIANLVLGRKGPLWYRGLVKSYKEHYKKVSLEDLNKILDFYDVEHIIIGHTIVDDQVTRDFNGKIIRVDIKHNKTKFSGKSQALLIEGEKYYIVNDGGVKSLLKP